jgi:hypothetical protein
MAIMIIQKEDAAVHRTEEGKEREKLLLLMGLQEEARGRRGADPVFSILIFCSLGVANTFNRCGAQQPHLAAFLQGGRGGGRRSRIAVEAARPTEMTTRRASFVCVCVRQGRIVLIFAVETAAWLYRSIFFLFKKARMLNATMSVQRRTKFKEKKNKRRQTADHFTDFIEFPPPPNPCPITTITTTNASAMVTA